MPGPRGFGKQERAQNPIETTKRLLKYMSKHVSLFIIIGLLIVLSVAANVVSTYILKYLINDGILPLIGKDINTESLQPFIAILSLLASTYIVSIVCESLINFIMTRITNKTLNTIRNELFDKMQKLPLSYFDSHTHGELMAYFTSDVGTIRDMVGETLPNMFSSVLSIISVFAMMVYISPLMTITILFLMAVMFFFTKFIMKKSMYNYKEQQESISKLNGYMEEMMAGTKVVKVFTREDNTIKDFAKINERARRASTRANIYAGVMGPFNNNLSHINYAICSIIGAYLVIVGTIDLGSLVSFLNYTKKLTDPLGRIAQRFNALLNAIAGAERIFTVLDLPDDSDLGKVKLVNATFDENNNLIESKDWTGLWAWKNDDELIRLRGDVKFNNVTFSYVKNKVVLNNVSFYAKPGQKIAFVGATGAGKTTITNLINRFYDIQEGEILYDGINVKDINKASLRSSLAMVLQDTHLFTGSVKDNIKYGKLDASDEDVINAAKLANADEFITMLPEGYDTIIKEDGSNLSQGQRQLLAIARAAIANAPVLILDEATSSIDTRTEKLIEEGMDNLMAGRTVFVIAHRLSTVRNANAIMVLDQGQIIERGDHDDLLKQKGQYYKLYTGQFELD